MTATMEINTVLLLVIVVCALFVAHKTNELFESQKKVERYVVFCSRAAAVVAGGTAISPMFRMFTPSPHHPPETDSVDPSYHQLLAWILAQQQQQQQQQATTQETVHDD